MAIERIVYFAIAVLASFALGFFIGIARATSKYVRKQRELTTRVKVLENFKQAVKVLCPKIQDGEGLKDNGDYLPPKLKGLSIPVKEDEDTKTAELEIVRQGNARDF